MSCADCPDRLGPDLGEPEAGEGPTEHARSDQRRQVARDLGAAMTALGLSIIADAITDRFTDADEDSASD